MPAHTSRRVAILPGILLAFFTALPLAAQLPPALDEELRRIFEKEEYKAKPLGTVRWLDGGRSYALLEDSPAGKDLKDVVLYDTASGRREALAPVSRLEPPGASAPLKVEAFAALDRDRLLLFTDSKKVWRQNTRGDFWLFDRRKGTLRKLGGSAAPSSLMFAKLSPDGARAAYVRDNDLYVEDVETGAVTPLTRDGSATVVNGTSDWVNEEELDIRDGFRWSPDGKRIAFWQFDTSGVEIFTLVNDTDTLYPALTRFPYPKAGTRNSAARVGVVDVGSRATVWMQPPGDPREFYVARMDWVDAGTLSLERLNRLQNSNELLLADSSSGATRTVYRDASKTWVDVVDTVRWLSGNREFLWVSEKDGWRHVYRAARDGSRERRITNFEGDVIDLRGLDERGGCSTSSPPRTAPPTGTSTGRSSMARARSSGSRRPPKAARTPTSSLPTGASRSTLPRGSTGRRSPRSSRCRSTAPRERSSTTRRSPRRSPPSSPDRSSSSRCPSGKA